jgi:hypothetical protein
MYYLHSITYRTLRVSLTLRRGVTYATGKPSILY